MADTTMKVEVELTRNEGRFVSKDELVEALAGEVEGMELTVSTDNGESVFSIDSVTLV